MIPKVFFLGRDWDSPGHREEGRRVQLIQAGTHYPNVLSRHARHKRQGKETLRLTRRTPHTSIGMVLVEKGLGLKWRRRLEVYP